MGLLTLDTLVTQEHQGFTVDSFVATVNDHSAMGSLRYPEAVVRRMGEVINTVAAFFDISPRMLASQILHETGFLRFTGDVNWWQFNFAGLGSTGGVIGRILTVFNDKSTFQLEPTFSAVKSRSIVVDWEDIDIEASIWMGVVAVAVHHTVYLRGTPDKWDSKWSRFASNDPRLTAVIAAKSLAKKPGGILTTPRSYGGNWAVPGLKYGDMIVYIASLLQETSPVPGEISMRDSPVPLTVAHIPWENSNRTRETSLASGRGWITIHETGNPNNGANARMHMKWTHGEDGYGGGGSSSYEGVSFSYVIDDQEVFELVPRGEKSWQASDGANGPGNSSVSIETSINRDGNWSKTVENLAQFVVWLTEVDNNLSIDRIKEHYDWSTAAGRSKNCPTNLRANGGIGWTSLNARISQIKSAGSVPPPPPPALPEYRVIDGFWIIDEFDAKWDQVGEITMLSLVGKPISGIFMAPVGGAERRVQLYERGCLAQYAEGTPDGAAPDNEFHVRNVFASERRKILVYGKKIGLVAPEMR